MSMSLFRVRCVRVEAGSFLPRLYSIHSSPSGIVHDFFAISERAKLEGDGVLTKDTR